MQHACFNETPSFCCPDCTRNFRRTWSYPLCTWGGGLLLGPGPRASSASYTWHHCIANEITISLQSLNCLSAHYCTLSSRTEPALPPHFRYMYGVSNGSGGSPCTAMHIDACTASAAGARWRLTCESIHVCSGLSIPPRWCMRASAPARLQFRGRTAAVDFAAPSNA